MRSDRKSVNEKSMSNIRNASIVFVATLLTIGGCATSPEAEMRRQNMEADIDEILTYELDETEYGGPENCLSNQKYRSFRAIGDRHLLFEGRRDKQWVNILRGRCAGLNHDSVFVMKPSSAGRACDMDRFEVVDRSDALLSQGMGTSCTLGEFIPVTKAQVQEIDKRIEIR